MQLKNKSPCGAHHPGFHSLYVSTSSVDESKTASASLLSVSGKGVGPQESGALAGLAWKLIGGWNSCVSFACGLFPRVASSNGWLAFSCWSHNRSSRPDRWLVFISFAESSKAGWFFVRLRSNWVKMDKIECDYRATSDQIFIIDTLNNVSWGLPWWLDHLFLLTQCSLAWVATKVEGTSCLQAVLDHGETTEKNG